MVIALAVLLAVLALATLTVFMMTVLALEPPWLEAARHSLAEARYRAGGVLAEFGDWLRLGR
jgi:hypothetical protein